MKDFRVLQLVYSLDVGGLEQVVVDLCNGLAAAGVECHVGCLSHPGLKFSQAQVAGAWIGNERPQKRPLDVRTLWKLLRYVKTKQINLIHSHNPQAHYYGAAVSLLTGVTHIHTVHGRGNPLAPVSQRRALLRRILTRLTDRIIAVSEDVQTKLLVVDHLPSRKLTTILNGVDTERYQPIANNQSRQLLRAARQIPEDAFVIGSVGRLSREKNYPLLVEAFARVAASLPSVFLVLVGDGAEYAQIQKCVDEQRVNSRCLLAGTRADIPEWMQCLDVFCLSSDTEGTAITLLEALATGVPIVATDVGGNRAVVNPPECGLIVSARDPNAFAQACLQLLRDQSTRSQMGSAGRDRVIQHFSHAQMIESHLRLYKMSLAPTRFWM